MFGIPEWALGVGFIIVAVSIAKALGGRLGPRNSLGGPGRSRRDLAQAIDDLQKDGSPMSRSGWTSRSACSPSSGTSSESCPRSTNRAPEWRNGRPRGLKIPRGQPRESSTLSSGITTYNT